MTSPPSDLVFTFHDLLTRNLSGQSNRVALIHGDTRVSYGEVAEQVEVAAAWLHKQGVRRGDRVLVHLHRGIEEIVAMFAASRVGGVFVNIHYQWTIRQLDHVVKDCRPKIIVTDARRVRELSDAGIVNLVDAILVVGNSSEEPKITPWGSLSSKDVPSIATPIDKDLAAILYTSGSTGQPKGVMLSHHNIVSGARTVAKYLELSQKDVLLGLLPLSFDYGLNQLTTMCLVSGAYVLQPPVMPQEIVRSLQRYEITGLAAVPSVWVRLCRYLEKVPAAFPCLRRITNSGGKIPDCILSSMPKLFPDVRIFLMYGLTEAFRSTYLAPALFESKMGSMGKAIPNNEIFVINENGVCGPNEQGELVHRGALISLGYWANEEATRERIKPCRQLRHLIGDEKVVYSGDLVYSDADGCLWYVGRSDSLIKCNGFRISPTEVEEIVYQSRLVEDCVAFGIPDDELGQVVHITISAPPGRSADIESLSKYCREQMPAYMFPRAIHVWEGEMPRTSTGKLDRSAVERRSRSGGS